MKKWIAPEVEELEFKNTAFPLPWDETSGEEEDPLPGPLKPGHNHNHNHNHNPGPVLPGPGGPPHPGLKPGPGGPGLVGPDHKLGI